MCPTSPPFGWKALFQRCFVLTFVVWFLTGGGLGCKSDFFDSPSFLLDSKHEEALFKNLFGNSFLFSKGDEVWKQKRKTTAHAFYKDRLVHMLEALKDKVFDVHSQWLSSIEKDGSTKIDLSTDIIKIFQRFLAHVIFGDEELSFEMIEIKILDPKTGVYKAKSIPLCEAVEECFQ